MHLLRILAALAFLVQGYFGNDLKNIGESLLDDFKLNFQSESVKPFVPRPEDHKSLENETKSRRKKLTKSSRGFSDYEGYFNNRLNNNGNDDNNGWNPYSLSGQKDKFNSDSTIDWNVQKKDVSRQDGSVSDFNFPPFSPDYGDMMMMMQIMRKMDTSPSKSGIFSRILDNPTALVMVTFIPISLLLAAVLPLVTNAMMNGVTIPPLIPTAKARNFDDDFNHAEITLPIIRNLIDFGSRYLDNPDCLHRIFCEMAVRNTTENYLKRALDTATFITNDKLLETFGLRSFVNTVKSRRCDDLFCATMPEKTKLDLKQLMNDIMFKHSLSTKPKKR